MRSVFGLPCAHEMCVMSQHGHPVDLVDVHMFWRTLTVGDEEGVHRVHEDPEIPNALQLIDESLEVIKKGNPDQQMFYAHAIHSLIHPESIEVEEPITRQHTDRQKRSSTRRELSGWEHVEKACASDPKSLPTSGR
ncbi:hypothetical protein Dimus_025162, partial [Dionaea muscipula]